MSVTLEEPRTVATRRSKTTVSRKQPAGGTLPNGADSPRPEPTSSGRLQGSGSASLNLGNDTPGENTSIKALSNRELRELRKNEKKTRELRDNLEVRYHTHSFQRPATLIPRQREARQKELEREREEKEARERQEKLEVCYDPQHFHGNDVPTRRQDEKRQKALAREKERQREAWEREEKFKVRCDLISSNATSS